MRKILCFAFCLSVFINRLYAGNPQVLKAGLQSVTVYSTGAQMVHTVSLQLTQGNNEIVVDGLANTIDINSIQIKAPSTVVLMSQEFSNNYLLVAEKTPRIKMLQDSIELLNDNVYKIDIDIGNTNELLNVLKANKEIKGQQSGINIADLTKLMDYYESKQNELTAKLLVLEDKKAKTKTVIDKLQQQVTEEQSLNTAKCGRLNLQLNAAIAGKADLTISYVTPNAYWKPFYDIKVDKLNAPAQFLYKAKIVQTTGIDWKQVKLSLSTSVPSKFGNAPNMQSWFLGYVNPYSLGQNGNSFSNYLTGKAADAQLTEVVVTTALGIDRESKNLGYSASPAPEPVYVINGQIMSEQEFNNIDPNAIKSMNKLKPKEAENIYGTRAAGGATVVQMKDGLDDYVTVNNTTLNINFEIDKPYDVPTNGKEQVALLQNVSIPAHFEHYTIPKLDDNAYLLAEIDDWEKYSLMPGEANIVMEGTYVGKTFINPNAAKDTLSLTLGQDNRVVVQRERMQDFSTVKFLGCNKFQKFGYEITIKNNKSETINIDLKDQYPLSTNNDIEVELLESSNAEINKETGSLEWKINLAAGEIRKIQFSYSVKYPKDKTLNLY